MVEELDHINDERDRDDQTQTEEGEKSLPQQGTVCACINNSSIFHEDVTTRKSHYDCRCVCVCVCVCVHCFYWQPLEL